MLLKFIPICSKSLLNLLLRVYMEVLLVTQSLCHWWEQTFTIYYYNINTNEKPGKLLLKNMIKSLLVWLMCLSLQKNIKKVKWFIHFIGVYSV